MTSSDTATSEGATPDSGGPIDRAIEGVAGEGFYDLAREARTELDRLRAIEAAAAAVATAWFSSEPTENITMVRAFDALRESLR